MRYQLDRKFRQLDGSLGSLELTEILKEDAEVASHPSPTAAAAAAPLIYRRAPRPQTHPSPAATHPAACPYRLPDTHPALCALLHPPR